LLQDEVVASSEFIIVCGAIQLSSSMLLNITGAVVFHLVEHVQIPGRSRRGLYDGPRGRVIVVKLCDVDGIAVRKIDPRKLHLEAVSAFSHGIELLQPGYSYLS
jgi:hypothetical protein